MIRLADPVLGESSYINCFNALINNELSWRGKYVEQFEALLSDFLGVDTLSTSSGMGALLVALHAAGIGPGDRVIVPDLTFPGTASAVMAVGAQPVLVDVSWETLGLDRKAVAQAMSQDIRAIIPVHLYGMDSGDFSEFGVPVIEDACQAFGMVKPRCQPYTVYSFYANKVITTGEGGAVCGDLTKLAPWRNGGFDAEYSCVVPGLNYRMGNLQAAIGVSQMEQIDSLLLARLHNAKYYEQALGGKGQWLFCPQVPDPQTAVKRLADFGIESRPIFKPLHLQPAFRQSGEFPVAEAIWRTHISIPTGPHISESERSRVAAAIWGIRNGNHELQRVANSGS